MVTFLFLWEVKLLRREVTNEATDKVWLVENKQGIGPTCRLCNLQGPSCAMLQADGCTQPRRPLQLKEPYSHKTQALRMFVHHLNMQHQIAPLKQQACGMASFLNHTTSCNIQNKPIGGHRELLNVQTPQGIPRSFHPDPETLQPHKTPTLKPQLRHTRPKCQKS